MSYYEDGQVKEFIHIDNGKLCDPPDGSPAKIRYLETGEIIGGESSKYEQIPAQRVLELLNAAKILRVAAVLANVDQAVIPAGMPLPGSLNQPATDNVSKDGR